MAGIGLYIVNKGELKMTDLAQVSLILLAFSVVATLYVHFTTKNEKGTGTY